MNIAFSTLAPSCARRKERCLMIKLRNKADSTLIATITDEQLAFLKNMLVEEHEEDADYWIDTMTLEYFRENDCDPKLLQLLQDVIGEGEGVEVEWVEV
jgi:hypothetical protein